MSEQVSWQVELAVKPGKLAAFQALTHRMVESTHAEYGVLVYERYLSADGTVVYVYERYQDSAAAVAHLRRFSQMYGSEFADLVERRRFVVFGMPSAELKRMLEPLGATHFAFFAGFST